MIDLVIFIMQFLLSLIITHFSIARANPVPQESAFGDGYTTSDPSSGDPTLHENTGVLTLLLDGSNVVANDPFATPSYPNPYTEDYQVVPLAPGGPEILGDFNGLYDITEGIGDTDTVTPPEPPKCDDDHTHQLCCNDGLSAAARDRTRCEKCTLAFPIFGQFITKTRA